MTKAAFDSLFSGLGQLGLDEPYVRRMMPDWLSAAAAETETGLVELKLLLARRFGLNVERLLAEKPNVEFTLPATPRFKRTVRVSDQELTAAASISVAVARIVESAQFRTYEPPGSAAEVRQFVLDQAGGKWVSLRGLLQYCLQRGIPIVTLRQLPDGMPMMDGMVVRLEDRPVIVVAKKTPFKAWYAFIIAHELAHIHYGDVGKGELLLDDDFQSGLSGTKEKDQEEERADQFAIAALSGELESVTDLLNPMNRPSDLARAAMRLGVAEHVDAGHLLLRLAYDTGDWQRALAALQVLDNRFEAFQELNEALFWSLDPQLLSQENFEFMYKVSGMTLPEAPDERPS